MGSIRKYETAKGYRYAVRFRKPDHSEGEKRGFRIKEDAKLYLASMDIAAAKGEYVDAASAKILIGALGVEWLARQEAHLKPSAFRVLEIAWRIHVEPRWGKIPLARVKHTDVQAWISDTERSASTIIRNYGVLMGIIDDAVRDKMLTANPGRDVKLPRKAKKARVYLSHQQVALLASHSGDHAALVEFLAYTGLRWGEATALRVKSLDMLRRRVNITENAVTVGTEVIVGTPKNHTARSVPFPAFLGELLARQCEGRSRDSLLFGSGLVHLPNPGNNGGWFTAALKAAQSADKAFDRVTPHDLRHTAASLAISAGANVKAVQRMLGHASAAMTLDTYADLFDDDLDAVGAALDQARTDSVVGKARAKASIA